MRRIAPLSDWVLVKRTAAEENTGHIYIPETAREKPQTAKVIAVGPGKVLDSGALVEPRVKVGDVVWLEKWSGTEVESEGMKYLFVRESAILGVSQ